jgi:hypothetical protein
MSRTAGDRTVTLATPINNTVPTLGKKCGRRERGADALSRWERSHLPSTRFETVEGILVFGMASPFAGRRRKGGLGRSVTTRGVSSSLIGRTGDSRMSEGRRGGERRLACAIQKIKAHAPGARRLILALASRETRPSLGPSTRARRSSLCCGGESRRRWRALFGIAIGHTQARGRNRHRGRIGRT